MKEEAFLTLHIGVVGPYVVTDWDKGRLQGRTDILLDVHGIVKQRKVGGTWRKVKQFGSARL